MTHEEALDRAAEFLTIAILQYKNERGERVFIDIDKPRLKREVEDLAIGMIRRGGVPN